MELLEIAKANAAKALGTANFDLPASLRTAAKETSQRAAVLSSGAKMEVSIFRGLLQANLLTLSVYCREPSWDVLNHLPRTKLI